MLFVHSDLKIKDVTNVVNDKTPSVSSGYIPQWDCVESNPNSYILATKLGFEKINENIDYWFKL